MRMKGSAAASEAASQPRPTPAAARQPEARRGGADGKQGAEAHLRGGPQAVAKQEGGQRHGGLGDADDAQQQGDDMDDDTPVHGDGLR